MSRSLVATLLPVIAACGPSGDPLNIYYVFTQGSEQTCTTSAGDPIHSCSDVPMTCNSVGLLRIVDPDDNTHVYVDQCARIPDTSAPPNNLCAINRTFGPLNPFPTSRVEIQLAIYPHEIKDVTGAVVSGGVTDDPVSGDPVCPSKIDFTTTGFAAPTNDVMPAFAGRAFSDGYDSEVTVELGCSDPGLIDTNVCRDENALDVTAAVLDFDQQVSVDNGDADGISVRVGQPQPVGPNWVFDIANTFELPRVDTTPPPPTPEWAGFNIDVSLTDYACIQALDVDGGSVASLNCRTLTAPVPTMLDLTGYRVGGNTLDDVLTALGQTDLPSGGLVLGIVENVQTGLPAAGATVHDSAGSTVEYLSADRMSFGGTATTSTGIFISNDAAFEVGGAANHWIATAPTLIQANDPVGGLVNFRLSIVVIQMNVGF